MRLVFIGALESSYRLLKRVMAGDTAQVVGVVTRSAAPGNADFRSLAPLAAEIGCPCLLVDRAPETDLASWIGQMQADIVYCFGWSWLLGPAILTAAPQGVVGYHPTLLPLNRGRHPIIWALALGLDRTGSTFFRMDEGADSGDILSQVTVEIAPDDTAASLYARLMDVAEQQVDAMTQALARGALAGQPQDHSRANIWRKRGKADGCIDWRMPARGIYNLVRALTRPYVGAHCSTPGGDIKIWQGKLGPHGFHNCEPGKVLALDGDAILVKCGDGSLWLCEHEFLRPPKVGDYL